MSVLLREVGAQGLAIAIYIPALVGVGILFGQREAFVSLIVFGASEIIQTDVWTDQLIAQGIVLAMIGLFFVLIRPALRRDAERAANIALELRAELKQAQDAAGEIQELFLQAPVGLARVGLDGRWITVNDRLCELMGYSHDELQERTFGSITHPEDFPSSRTETLSLLSGQIVVKRKRYIRKDGRAFWAARGARRIQASTGTPSNFVVSVEDIATETDTTNEMRRRLSDTTDEIERLRSAMRGAGIAAFEYSRETGYLKKLDGSEALIPSSVGSETPLDTLFALASPRDRERLQEAIQYSPRSDCAIDISFAIRHSDGVERQLRLKGYGARGVGEIVSGVVFDETDHHEEENSRALRIGQDLLVKELTHRLGNIFPVISSMIRLTAETRPEAEELANVLQNRVRSLALTHRLLAARGLSTVGLEELLRLEISPYATCQRIVLAGPSISLMGGMAESFSIIAHELVTNAVKYGALSHQSGEIEATWRIDPSSAKQHLHFDWIERKSTAANLNARAGFGTNVLGLQGTPIVGTKATARATEDGLHYTLVVQMDRRLSLAEEFLDNAARSPGEPRGISKRVVAGVAIRDRQSSDHPPTS